MSNPNLTQRHLDIRYRPFPLSVFFHPSMISFPNTSFCLLLCLPSSTPPMLFSPSLSLPHCFLCGWRCIMKSAAPVAWLTHKDAFSVPGAKLFTDSYSAANTSVLPAKTEQRANQAVAWLFPQAAQAWENVGMASGDARSATDIKWNTEGGLWHALKCQPVTACLSNTIPKCTSFWKHITKQWCTKTKGTSPLSRCRTPSSSLGECTLYSPSGKLDSCTLNYSSHLQTKLKPTLPAPIFPNAPVQRGTQIVRSMGY